MKIEPTSANTAPISGVYFYKHNGNAEFRRYTGKASHSAAELYRARAVATLVKAGHSVASAKARAKRLTAIKGDHHGSGPCHSRPDLVLAMNAEPSPA